MALVQQNKKIMLTVIIAKIIIIAKTISRTTRTISITMITITMMIANCNNYTIKIYVITLTNKEFVPRKTIAVSYICLHAESKNNVQFFPSPTDFVFCGMLCYVCYAG